MLGRGDNYSVIARKFSIGRTLVFNVNNLLEVLFNPNQNKNRKAV